MRQAVISENLDAELCGDRLRLKYQRPTSDGWQGMDLTLVEVVRLKEWLDKELESYGKSKAV